jgi:hypothetical protein
LFSDQISAVEENIPVTALLLADFRNKVDTPANLNKMPLQAMPAGDKCLPPALHTCAHSWL